MVVVDRGAIEKERRRKYLCYRRKKPFKGV